jgi:biopolymer transport protein ExbD
MKFFNNKERALNVEITPLIDIVFLLVIFFVVTSKIETNQYLSLDLPSTESFSSSLINGDRNIILLDTGILVVNNQEFNISTIENKAFHEWVITLMDELQSAGFQNLQIKTYTDQS